MLDSIVQLYRKYRHELRVPNPDTYRRAQIRGLLFVGLAADVLFALAYLFITLTDSQFTSDTIPVLIAVILFLGVTSLAFFKRKIFDRFGAHMLMLLLLTISFTLVPHVSSALMLVMMVKVVVMSGILTRPVFTWIYSFIGLVMFGSVAFGKYPMIQVFGFMAIYSYVTIAGFLVAEMLNSLFAMHAESTNSMQQLYMNDKKLFSSLAHRLKTPVAVLRGQLLKGREVVVDNELLVPLDEITAAINELTVLSKMNLSKALATKQRLDLQDLLKEIQRDGEILAANFERLHGQKRIIRFISKTYTVSPVAYFAPQQIKEALLNIIDNSIRHNSAKDLVHIDIKLSMKNNKYCIGITDDGVGISEEQLRNLLAKHTVVGDGESPIDMHVGLEISRNLIQANGGDLFIYSQPGQGTTVEISLKNE